MVEDGEDKSELEMIKYVEKCMLILKARQAVR